MRIHRTARNRHSNLRSMSERIRDISTETEWNDVLRKSHDRPVVLFKHSNSCGLSSRAQRQIERLTDPGDPDVYRIVVQTARPISDYVEHVLGIRHESPQVFVLAGGNAVYDSSHHAVTAENIRDAMTAAKDKA